VLFHEELPFMEQLLLVNPRRRRRRNSRRMPAGLRRYWAKHRRGRHRVHLTNPRRRRRNSRSLFMARRRRRRNPRVHGYIRRRAHHRRHNPRYRRRRYAHHRRRLRNPRRAGGFGMRGLMRNAVMPAMIGGTGALVLDVVDGYVAPYLPATLQSGYLRLIMKGVGAVAIGMVASRFLGRERGRVVMLGALTVTAYSAIRSAVQGAGIPGLSGYGDYTPFPMHGLLRSPPGSSASRIGPSSKP